METTIKKITEEQFYDYFTLVENHIDNNASFSGNMFETYGSELQHVQEMAKQNRVITIIETDGDELDEEGDLIPNMYYVSGMHHINRIGYLITAEPIDFEFECLID